MPDDDIDLSTNIPTSNTVNSNDKIPIIATAVPITSTNNQNDDNEIINQQPTTTRPILQTSNITSFSTSNMMTTTALDELRQQGYPLGLAQELGNTKASYPLRFWIVDNSG